MAAITWYETLDGKLAMGLVLLLAILSVLMVRSQMQLSADDPATEAHTTLSTQAFEQTRASNLAELPALTPFETPPEPPKADEPEQTPSATPIANDPAPKPTTQPKTRKHHLISPLLLQLQ